MTTSNGGSSLSKAWDGLDTQTVQQLTVNELDRLHNRINASHTELAAQLRSARDDFTQRLDDLRTEFRTAVDVLRGEMREAFDVAERRQARITGLLLTIIGGVVVGLVMLVVQLSGGG